MATITISGPSLNPTAQLGQVQQSARKLIIPIVIDFTAVGPTTYIVDLTQQATQGLFDVVRTLFFDNSANPSSVTVSVSKSGQTFPIAPFASGYYTIFGTALGQISFTSNGNASAKSNVQLLNYDVPSSVQNFGVAGSGNPVTIVDGGDATLGAKADVAVVNPASAASVVALLKGILTEALNIANPYAAALKTGVSGFSGNQANATAAASLAPAVGKTNYVRAVQVAFTGATAASNVLLTISGLLGGTITIPLAVPAGVNTQGATIILAFGDDGFPGSAPNTAITVSLPALGAGNVNAAVNIEGYQQ